MNEVFQKSDLEGQLNFQKQVELARQKERDDQIQTILSAVRFEISKRFGSEVIEHIRGSLVVCKVSSDRVEELWLRFDDLWLRCLVDGTSDMTICLPDSLVNLMTLSDIAWLMTRTRVSKMVDYFSESDRGAGIFSYTVGLACLIIVLVIGILSPKDVHWGQVCSALLLFWLCVGIKKVLVERNRRRRTFAYLENPFRSEPGAC